MAAHAGDDCTPNPPDVMHPHSLSHVVLKTPAYQFEPMKRYYKTFLGATIVWENDFICFLNYDDEHHRVGIFALPGTVPKPSNSAGLAHLCFTFSTLRDLATSYRQRKEHGMEPCWCVNHGATTSMYYKDPDDNDIEVQVKNFDDQDEANGFMETEEFRMNPVGTDFDPEEFVGRVESGEDEREIKKRREIGPRMEP